ncbi:insulinoma-associated protein 2 [Megalops cyprinoides]|uniref:insulinoma-associated protein 2 n=1 Tax=Megalops cyprinoides TaxID=118141 RepID=UPI00186413AE|nr:insulinoma-associated protein 2 [Megalops cyprinoides]
MPRGFLVKRSKRTSPASYRMRDADRDPPNVDLPQQTEGQTTVAIACSDVGLPADARESWASVPAETEQAQLSESAEKAERSVVSTDNAHVNIGDPAHGSPGRADASYSPIKPVGTELKKSFFERCLSSPAMAESFPISAPVSSMERLLMNHSPFPPSEMKFDTPVHLYSPLHHVMKRSYVDSDRKGKPSAKKPKVMRKLSFEDEVTTSPVLGLKIKKETPESKAPSSSGSKKPLGEFICQLCKEEYPDPFSLAQHKCSRIVRVEYRCPECDKVFSCPANLASHRRWHKPRPVNGESQSGKKSQLTAEHDPQKPSAEGKENASKMLVNDQHHPSLDSSQFPVQQQRPADGAHGQDQLRRKSQESSAPVDQSYKDQEKCFDLHLRATDGSMLLGCSETTDATASSYLPSPGPSEEVYECRYCSKKFRRQAYLRKHLAAHETIRSSTYNQIESGQITFPCHLCGAHFPSAEIRDKHRLWHAVREDILVNPGKSVNALVRPDLMQREQQIFTCKHCPSTFFSSPGLTRHINKSHPTENRQVMLLQMPVRPGC